jgi:hypothetical protein
MKTDIKPLMAAAIGVALGYLAAKERAHFGGEATAVLSNAAPVGAAAKAPPPRTSRPSPSGATAHTKPARESQPLSDSQRDQQAQAQLVKDTAAARDSEYTQLFTNLRVPAWDIARYKSNLVTLHKLAVEAGSPMTQLMKARHEYDQQMRTELGEESYTRYRAYEESKPARAEYRNFEQYVWKTQNRLPDTAYADIIVELMRASGATTFESWDGPYDPPPRPRFGKEAFTNSLNQETLTLKSSSASFMKAIRNAQVPAELRADLEAYYNDRIQNAEERLTYYSRPDEEIAREEKAKRIAEIEGLERTAPKAPP